MRTLKDLSAAGKRIIVRADYNVPMEAGKIADVSRVKASLPTLQRLLEQGASLVLLSHLGRPNGRFEATSSLAPVTPVLAAQLQRPVTFIGGSAERTPASDATLRQVLPLPQGSVALLDNVRFEPGEGSNDAALARRYARLGETFVLDAFASAHRDHASVTGATRFLPSCAGLLMEKEVANLTRLIQRPAKPFWVVLGGSKAADKIGAVESLLPRVTGMLIGGALAFPFIEAQGGQVGNSLVAAETAGLAKSLLGMAHDRGVQLLLPVDVVAAPKPAVGAEARIVPANHIPAGWKGLDIGPQTRQRFVEALQGARTVFWNGPMGAAEIDGFQGGDAGDWPRHRRPPGRLHSAWRGRHRRGRSEAEAWGAVQPCLHRWRSLPDVPGERHSSRHRGAVLAATGPLRGGPLSGGPPHHRRAPLLFHWAFDLDGVGWRTTSWGRPAMSDFQRARHATILSTRADMAIDAGLRSFMIGVYNKVALGLLVSAALAYLTSSVPPVRDLMFVTSADGHLAGMTPIGWIVAIAPLGILLVSGFAMRNPTSGAASALYWTIVALIGASLGVVGLVYTGASIVSMFLITATAFGALSLFGYVTKKDLTGFGSFLIVGVVGLVIASLVNLFLRSELMQFMISVIGVFVFAGLIAYDTQRLKIAYYELGGAEAARSVATSYGALSLYINFINLFQFLLSLFGQRRD